MSWLDNVGWPKVVLLLGALVIVLLVVVFSPEARLWIEDLAHHALDLVRDLRGAKE